MGEAGSKRIPARTSSGSAGDAPHHGAVMIALALGLLLASCSNGADDDNRGRGFYGGVSGGMTRLP